MLKVPNPAVEQTKRKGWDRRIENQPTASSNKHIKSQDLEKNNRYDKPNSHRSFANAKSNIVEVGRSNRDVHFTNLTSLMFIDFYPSRHFWVATLLLFVCVA